MKKFLMFITVITICGCNATPVTSNPSVSQYLFINAASNTPPSVAYTGQFFDISAPATYTFPTSGTGQTGQSFSFTTGKHDTIEFKINFSSPCTFAYGIGPSSTNPGTTSGTAVTDSNGQYTSSQFTF
jgi:hypothetical protein